MIELRQWIGRNVKRPIAFAIGVVLSLQTGYLVYLAYNEYSSQIRRIERMVETASLGIQQDNRPLIEATLIAGLQNSDAARAALCHGSTARASGPNSVPEALRSGMADLMYPPSGADPCLKKSGNLLHWMVRRNAIGVADYEFVFIINTPKTFAFLAVLTTITTILLVSLMLILARARKRFETEVIEPLCGGLNEETTLGIAELDAMRRRNQQHNELSRRQSVSEALLELSAQVAHDIRSPLAALDSVLKDVSQLPEEKRIIVRSATSRIRDIANDLIEKNREIKTTSRKTAAPSAASEPATIQLLSSLIDPLITEKRLQFRSKIGIEIEGGLDASSYGLFAKIQPTEFKRVLSNLINNAVEALGEKGIVTVSLACDTGQILLKVQDDGKGIPPEILSKLGQKGQTHGKSGGSGLGLYHARTSLELWGGSLGIASIRRGDTETRGHGDGKLDSRFRGNDESKGGNDGGSGTTVTIKLPQAEPPEWFVSNLELEPNSTIVVLDDDTSIHQVWQGRFSA
ncbi:MAG: HAMP domain-containing histidine kinase, partial [Elusimicrobia bacterium]|nr:HAMP domain-containing histidine kinase [Elusimicrobiota bacterium]